MTRLHNTQNRKVLQGGGASDVAISVAKLLAPLALKAAEPIAEGIGKKIGKKISGGSGTLAGRRGGSISKKK